MHQLTGVTSGRWSWAHTYTLMALNPKCLRSAKQQPSWTQKTSGQDCVTLEERIHLKYTFCFDFGTRWENKRQSAGAGIQTVWKSSEGEKSNPETRTGPCRRLQPAARKSPSSIRHCSHPSSFILTTLP